MKFNRSMIIDAILFVIILALVLYNVAAGKGNFAIYSGLALIAFGILVMVIDYFKNKKHH